MEYVQHGWDCDNQTLGSHQFLAAGSLNDESYAVTLRSIHLRGLRAVQDICSEYGCSAGIQILSVAARRDKEAGHRGLGQGDIKSLEDLHRRDFPDIAIVLKELVEDLHCGLEAVPRDKLAEGDQELFRNWVGKKVAGLQVRVLRCEDVDVGKESSTDGSLRVGDVSRHRQPCVEVEQQRGIVVRARGCQGDIEPTKVFFHDGNIVKVHNAGIDMGSCVLVDWERATDVD